ncbi:MULTISPECIES: hypothetical protein [Lactococcus]|nr:MULTISPECIES: hypothetical protein [Lactococcus]MBL3716066.1 hypothetical protein [Lactococcus garvieae]
MTTKTIYPKTFKEILDSLILRESVGSTLAKDGLSKKHCTKILPSQLV